MNFQGTIQEHKSVVLHALHLLLHALQDRMTKICIQSGLQHDEETAEQGLNKERDASAAVHRQEADKRDMVRVAVRTQSLLTKPFCVKIISVTV